MSILDINLIRFETGDRAQRRAVVDGTIRSLRTGFVYLEHDVPSDLLDTCYTRLGAFFALSQAEKARYAVPNSRGQRGYSGTLVEKAATSQHADWKEMLNGGDVAPDGDPLGVAYPDRYAPPAFPEAAFPGIAADLMRFHHQILALQRRFLRVVAVGLGASESFFDEMVEHGATLTRAAHYPPMASSPGQKHVWAAEHGDINLVTALPRATAPGLQIRTEEGWVDAEPSADHAILNTGMMLEHLSNGRLPTGIHRVIAAPAQHGDRIAVVQFCHPTPNTLLEPMPSSVTADRPKRFDTVTAADWLDQVLRDINLAG